ncbi:50S ribosomal protein L11 [Candidatus Pacearchaeota archaeon]|nr:50S ribosomal protein L11 [Candidatus Pacearchaeota archaeon]
MRRMIIKILAEGGNMQPGPALSQKLGPAGINVGQVISKVNEVTKDFKGLKVPVELDVDSATKEFEVRVFSPPVSELIKKELGIEKGSGLQKTFQQGNISIEQVISVAKQKMQNLLANDLKSAVKLVVGTCGTLGILVENKFAKEVQEEIDSGIYDEQIKNEIAVTPEDKKTELESYYAKLKKEQDKLAQQMKAKEEAKANK